MADSPDSKPDRKVEIDVAITDVIADNSVLKVLRSMTTTAQSLVAWETEYSYNVPDGKPDRKVEIDIAITNVIADKWRIKGITVKNNDRSVLVAWEAEYSYNVPAKAADKWRIKGITVKAVVNNFSVV